MSYIRVIPRDFFNEAKLLKCMGLLSLKILDNKIPIPMRIDEPGQPFNVIQAESDGSLLVENYSLTINGRYYTLSTPYNSKDNYPLEITTHESEDIRVFDEDGIFTDDFVDYVTNL